MPRLRHTIEQILAKLREIEIGEQVAWLMTPTTITSRSRVRWCWWYRQYTGRFQVSSAPGE